MANAMIDRRTAWINRSLVEAAPVLAVCIDNLTSHFCAVDGLPRRAAAARALEALDIDAEQWAAAKRDAAVARRQAAREQRAHAADYAAFRRRVERFTACPAPLQ